MQPLGPLLPFVLIGALCGMTGATTANCLDNLVSIDNGSNPDTFMYRYSSGKQLNDLGVWSGCHGIPSAQYCLITPMIGACLPDICSEDDVKENMPLVYQALHIFGSVASPNVQCDSGSDSMGVGAIIMLCVLAALGLAVLLSSGIDISLRHMKSVSFPVSIEPFLLSFSCFSTAKVLLARRPSSGTALLDGLRFFSMAYIIYHHTEAVNLEAFWSWSRTVNGQFAFSGQMSVEVFFFLGGFLLMYGTTRKLDREPDNLRSPFFWLTFYLHRYVRISSVLYMATFVWWTLSPVISDGPLYSSIYRKIEETCDHDWYQTLLYCFNFFQDPWENGCLQTAWYLCVDMQIFIFTPLIIVPTILWRRFGWIMSSGVLLTLTIATGAVLAFAQDMTMFMEPGNVEGFNNYFQQYYVKVQALLDSFGQSYLSPRLDKPYCRAPSYILGMISAVLFSDYREQITKRMKSNFLSIVAFLASIAMMIAILLVPVTHNNHPWPEVLATLWVWTCRPLFCAALCITVLIMLNRGQAPIISVLKGFLELEVWAAPAKLSFGAYLYHWMLLQIMKASYKQLPYFQFSSVIMEYLAVLVTAYALSAMSYFLVEEPISSIEKHLLASLQSISRISIDDEGGGELEGQLEDEKVPLMVTERTPQ